MCDDVTHLLRTACFNQLAGTQWINSTLQNIRERLEQNPEKMIRFNLYCGEAAGPTEWANIRVQFFRCDWKRILDTLNADHNGTWNEETLMYEARLSDESLFEVSADAVEQEVLVVFW
jgi:hypothetical protein